VYLGGDKKTARLGMGPWARNLKSFEVQKCTTKKGLKKHAGGDRRRGHWGVKKRTRGVHGVEKKIAS